ncbi:MAG: response regulator, partial [Gammaproteobacteria bacterium]|nr:response regulator [Gammaproteobacteria bacterium]
MRILLIDDHALFRAGLTALLERRGIEVVSSASAQAGIEQTHSIKPDVILLDLRMPGIGGLDTLRELRSTGIELPIVMLTTSADEQDLSDCLRSGASGYLLKDMAPDELVNTLHQVVNGATVVAPSLAGVLAKIIQQGDSGQIEDVKGPVFSKLTPREFEILCHLSEGQSNKAIARDLNISDGT